MLHLLKGIGRKFSRERATKKKDQKIALFSLFQEGGATKNSNFKPLSTIFAPRLKIQGEGHGPPAPHCRSSCISFTKQI